MRASGKSFASSSSAFWVPKPRYCSLPPQAGHLACLLYTSPEDYEYKFIDFVNPEILAVSEDEETAYEGCLSFLSLIHI